MTTTGFSGATVPLTQDTETLQLWRAALAVYRRVNREKRQISAMQAENAAVGVILHLRPDLDWREASRIAIEAVAACSTRYGDWLWQTRENAEPPEWWEA